MYGIAALMLCLVTVLSVEWPLGNKSLGDEHISHIYSNTSFRLLSVSVTDEDQLFLYNYDSRYNDYFAFEYDDETDSYLILYRLDGSRKYLMETEDHELRLSDSSEGSRCRWDVERCGNSMFFLLINEEDGFAVCETDDCHVVMMPADEGNINMQMRLQ